MAILCNQAACHLKLGDGAAALEVADRASTFKAPVDGAAGVKAAYRRACALEAVGDLDEARVAFKSVLDVDPKNSHCVQVTSANDGAVLLHVCVAGSGSLRGPPRTNLQLFKVFLRREETECVEDRVLMREKRGASSVYCSCSKSQNIKSPSRAG